MKKFVMMILVLMGFSFSSFSQVVPLEGLPVSVQSLDLTQNANNIRLEWKVACYINEASFLVQRSSDGINYTTINSFTADRLRCQQPFFYNDDNIAGKIYYRIKVGDKDGNMYASKIVSANGKIGGFIVNSFWPTIINNSAVINISSASKDNVTLQVTSLSGRRSWQKVVNLEKGSNETRLDLSSLSKGSYVLTTINSFGEKSAIRFLKQ